MFREFKYRIHCHNIRQQDTIVMMGNTVRFMQGKRLTYKQLIGC